MRPNNLSRRAAALAIAAGLIGAAALPAAAQSFPSKPIRLVVPFPTGGGTHCSARTASNKTGEQMGQPVIVDNKSGAGSIRGAQAASSAAPAIEGGIEPATRARQETAPRVRSETVNLAQGMKQPTSTSTEARA